MFGWKEKEKPVNGTHFFSFYVLEKTPFVWNRKTASFVEEG
jgi:hypothetical protein